MGKSSASPTVASQDPEARGGSPGYHQAQVTRGDAGGSIRPGAKRAQLVRDTSHPGKHLSRQRSDTQEPQRTT